MAKHKEPIGPERVIRKYLGDPLRAIRNLEVFGSSAMVGSVAAADIILTGGVGTGILLATSSIMGAWGWMEYKFQKNKYNKVQLRPNAAGQTVESSLIVYLTLRNMELKLQHAFQKAASPKASPKDLSKVQSLAEDIQQDLRALSSAFTIAASPKGSDLYEFVVAEYSPSPGTDKLVTLNELLASPGSGTNDLKAKLERMPNLRKPRSPSQEPPL